MIVTRLAIAARLSLLTLAVAVPAAAPAGDRPDGDSYYGYRTHPGGEVIGRASEDIDATFVTPEVVDVPPPAPFGPPEVDAGLPPAIPTPTFAGPTYGPANQIPWEWYLLPGDVLFDSFLAGMHAPRMAGEAVSSSDEGVLLDTTIGGRFSLFRKGTIGPDAEGWEVQIAAAALTRLATDQASDVEAVDYSLAVPLAYRRGPTAYRFGYDHISSHVGDEYLIRNPDFERINYVRDALEFAVIHDLTEDVAVYGELNYAFHNTGGSEPVHLQFGAEYEPDPTPGFRGAPVAAVNTLLREEFGYEGNLGLMAGWQWRGMQSDDVLRLAMTFYTGRSRQFSFFDRYETLVGAGLYYDY